MKNFKGDCCFYTPDCEEKRCEVCKILPEMTEDQLTFITEKLPIGFVEYVKERTKIRETEKQKFKRLLNEANDGSYSYQTGRDKENDRMYFIMIKLIICAEKIICKGEL